MNKKNMRKELKRLEKRDTELNNEIKEVRAELEQANEQLERLTEQNKELNKKQETIEKVQEQQGIDIKALAEALDDLEDKKTVFIDEIAENEDKYNTLMKLIKENPNLEHELSLGLGSCQSAMRNSRKSQSFIEEKMDKINKMICEIVQFSKNNYNNL